MQSKLTTRSQEAVTAAQRLAVDRGQAALEPLHLLAALLEQTDGIAGPLLKAVGADVADVRAKTEAALRRMPSVSGATVSAPSPSRELLRVINAAGEQAGALGDEYVSTEHLLVGLAASDGEALSGREGFLRAGGELALHGGGTGSFRTWVVLVRLAGGHSLQRSDT
jgi:ATP-dependent Clp protease ATP-binding subunit ClpB